MDHKLVLTNVILLFLYPTISKVVHGKVTISCDQTPYPQVCKNFVKDNKLPEIDVTDSAFPNVTLRIIFDQARVAHRNISLVDFTSLDGRTKMAWEDCLVLYEDTVHQLNQTFLSSPDSHPNLDDIQTYLSAAMANHETCKSGFIDFNLPTHLQQLELLLTDFFELLTRALVIGRSLTPSSTATPLMGKRGGRSRRLLTIGFPTWVSMGDRKLLQSSSIITTKPDVVVAKDGTGDYKTISEAIVASEHHRSGTKRFFIYVKKGVYHENVVVTNKMKNLMLVGDGIDATIVTGSRNVQDGCTTFNSATFAVSGNGFIARGITFENTAGPEKHQAVALRSSSDFSIFYQCSFKGYQDTLYAHSKRQFYKNCDIYGTVDFIFGDSATIIQSSNIYVRKPMTDQTNTVTAQGRSNPNENTGIVIQNSVIGPALEFKPFQRSVQTFLGRPWKEYSRVVIMKCLIDGLVDSAGWAPWSGDFAIKTLYYAEYMNIGAGSGTSGRVKWPGHHVMSSPIEAGNYTVETFLAGDRWIPATGVPYEVGL